MESTRRGILISGLSAHSSYQTVACGRTGRRGAPPALQRRMALLQGRSRRRRAGGLRRFQVAGCPPAARLGHRRALRPQAQSAHRRAAHLRHRLVSQALHASRQRSGPLLQHRVRWRHVELQRLAQRAGAGRPSLRLQQLRARPHAAPEVRRRSQRAGGAADARRSLLALVSRRRHLSQRVAHDDRAGARGALGHLRHHARGHRRAGHRRGEGRDPQPRRPAGQSDAADDHPRSRRENRGEHGTDDARSRPTAPRPLRPASRSTSRSAGTSITRTSTRWSPKCWTESAWWTATRRRSASARSSSTRRRASC